MELSGGNFFVPVMKRLVSSLALSDNRELKDASISLSAILSKFSDQDEQGPSIELDSDEDDRPVVVSMEDYKASMSRSIPPKSTQSNDEHKLRYPILFAAILPHEDVIMACARALDQQVDVSLVREAARYLQEVEDRR